MASVIHAGRFGATLVGASLGLVQAHYFEPFSGLLLAVTAALLYAFSAISCVGRALLIAAILLVASRLPGLGPGLGTLVFTLGVTGLCAFRRRINTLFPY